MILFTTSQARRQAWATLDVHIETPAEQGGIFTGKVGRIFQRRIEKSQEILKFTPWLAHIFKSMLSYLWESYNFHWIFLVRIQNFFQEEQFNVKGRKFLSKGNISCQKCAFYVLFFHPVVRNNVVSVEILESKNILQLREKLYPTLVRKYSECIVF